MGLWALRSPQEYGGSGLSTLATCVVMEEAVKCRMGAYIPAIGAIGSTIGAAIATTPPR